MYGNMELGQMCIPVRIAEILRMSSELLMMLAQAGQSISGGRYPSQEDLTEQGKPTTPGLVLGALTYLWLVVGRR